MVALLTKYTLRSKGLGYRNGNRDLVNAVAKLRGEGISAEREKWQFEMNDTMDERYATLGHPIVQGL